MALHTLGKGETQVQFLLGAPIYCLGDGIGIRASLKHWILGARIPSEAPIWKMQ